MLSMSRSLFISNRQIGLKALQNQHRSVVTRLPIKSAFIKGFSSKSDSKIELKQKTESKGEKITRKQKKEERKRDIHNKEDQATHPHGRHYDSEKEKEAIKKVVVAESLTCGKLADLFGSHNNAGIFFIGGLDVYTLQNKAKLLGVERKHADEVDCVSPKVAAEMADGILKLFGKEAEVGVGVTGFAKTEGVKDLEPHAFFCVTTSEGEKRQGKIEGGLKGKERNEVRKIVAERVYLETCKVIGLKPEPKVANRHSEATIEEEDKKKTKKEIKDAKPTAKKIRKGKKKVEEETMKSKE